MVLVVVAVVEVVAVSASQRSCGGAGGAREGAGRKQRRVRSAAGGGHGLVLAAIETELYMAEAACLQGRGRRDARNVTICMCKARERNGERSTGGAGGSRVRRGSVASSASTRRRKVCSEASRCMRMRACWLRSQWRWRRRVPREGWGRGGCKSVAGAAVEGWERERERRREIRRTVGRSGGRRRGGGDGRAWCPRWGSHAEAGLQRGGAAVGGGAGVAWEEGSGGSIRA